VGKYEQLYRKIMLRQSDANVSFDGACVLLGRLGFASRIKGDHFIFSKAGVEEILNLQPVNSKCKPYQVKQIRDIILRYKLKLEE
jgi:hypothetical protein